MKKVAKNRILLLAVLFIVLASAFSFIAYANSRGVDPEDTQCCLTTESAGGSEMLWDVLSRQFVSAVHLP